VKGKLDEVWASKEQEVEHARLVTRYEAEKAGQAEIQRLLEQVSLLERQLRRQEEETTAARNQVELLLSLKQENNSLKFERTESPLRASGTVNIERFAEEHAKTNQATLNNRASPLESSSGEYSCNASEQQLTASQMKAHRQSESVGARASLTKESIEAAEERRWQCEYYLLENENSRLKKDLTQLQT